LKFSWVHIFLGHPVYGYTKPGEWIQILTKVVSVIYCSAGGSNGILCFLAVT